MRYENSAAENAAYEYIYDSNGNMTYRFVLPYNTPQGEHNELVSMDTYTYSTGTWQDMLTSFNNQTITYDQIGNPTSYRGWTMDWQGRQLISAAKGSTSLSYTYDADGIRMSKTVNGTKTEYGYANGHLRYQKTGNNIIWFTYNAQGSPMSITYNGTTYFYVKNLQGDVMGIADANGNLVVEYTYDAWGKWLGYTGSMASTLGRANPLLYRGYYFDWETGIYYLNSRYYDAYIRRFINADALISATNLNGMNLFAYCYNNPVNYIDFNGYSGLTLQDYQAIHTNVQLRVAIEKKWDMEVYVSGSLGKGRLDLYDPNTHTYYEVKSRGASKRTATVKQMNKYDVSTVQDGRYSSPPKTSPARGLDVVSGSFQYKEHKVNYYTESEGLIIYDVFPIEEPSKEPVKSPSVSWEAALGAAAISAVVAVFEVAVWVLSQGASGLPPVFA